MSDLQAPEIKRGLRPAQAAARMGCSLPTFWRIARADPDFPALAKLSPRVTVVDAAELDRFVEAKKSKRVVVAS